MRKFQIYKHPDGRLNAVREGFSVPAAIFGAFWLLWHKIWIHGAVAAVIGVGLYVVFPSPAGYLLGIPYGHRFGTADVLNVAICLLIGAFGNEWLGKSLSERGFENVSVELAATAEGATAEYLRAPIKTAGMGTSDQRKEPFL